MKTQLEALIVSGIPLFLLPDGILQAAVQEHNRAEPTNGDAPWLNWDEVAGWREMLFVRANSYHPMPMVYDHLSEDGITFGKWRLRKKALPHSGKLRTHMKGDKHGWVQFDGPVDITVLTRDNEPIMSLTPSELLSLRPGIKKAKGDVVITGLGLGYLLMEVCKRKQVKHVTVIERDPLILETIVPMLKPYLARHVDFIRADCNEVLHRMRGDVLLADHFDTFGGNAEWWPCKNESLIRQNFKTIWVWG